MNLASMAALICEKIGKTDAASVSACKLFLRRRHELCYDRTLWKDTLITREVAVAAGQSFVTLPFEAARPLVCWNATAGQPMETSSLFTSAMIDPAGLKEAGWAVAFAEVDSVGWPFDLTLGTGGASAVAFINTDAAPVDVNIYGEFVFAASGITPTAVTMSQTLTVPGNGAPAISQKWVAISRMTKAQSSQPLIVAQSSPIPESTWIWPADVESVEFGRVRLLSPADRAFSLGVLAKRRLRQMRLDADPPMIRGIDNALLALGEGDMLERSRQYGKAASKVKEGLELLRLAVDQEVNQSAYSSRIVPVVSEVEGTQADLY